MERKVKKIITIVISLSLVVSDASAVHSMVFLSVPGCDEIGLKIVGKLDGSDALADQCAKIRKAKRKQLYEHPAGNKSHGDYWMSINATLKKSDYYRRLALRGTIVPVLNDEWEMFSVMNHMQRVETAACMIAQFWKKQWGNQSETQNIEFNAELLRFFSIANAIGDAPFSFTGMDKIKMYLKKGYYNRGEVACEIMSEILGKYLQKDSPFPLRTYMQEAKQMLGGNIEQILPEAQIAALADGIIRIIEMLSIVKMTGCVDPKSDEYERLKHYIHDLFGIKSAEYFDAFLDASLNDQTHLLIGRFVSRHFMDGESKYFIVGPQMSSKIQECREKTADILSRHMSRICNVDRLDEILTVVLDDLMGIEVNGLGQNGNNGKGEVLDIYKKLLQLDDPMMLEKASSLQRIKMDDKKNCILKNGNIRVHEKKRNFGDIAIRIKLIEKQYGLLGISRKLGISPQLVWIKLQDAQIRSFQNQYRRCRYHNEQEVSRLMRAVKKEWPHLLMLAHIINTPYVKEKLGVGKEVEKVLGKIPVLPGSINENNIGEIIDAVSLLITFLDATYIDVHAPFDQLFDVTTKGALVAWGDIKAIIRYNLIYLRLTGYDEEIKNNLDARASIINDEELSKKAGRERNFIRNIEKYDHDISMAAYRAIIKGLSCYTFEYVPKKKESRFLSFNNMLVDADRLEQARAIVMAYETINCKDEQTRRMRLHHLDTMPYRTLTDMLISEKRKNNRWLGRMLEDDARDVFRYCHRLNRKLGRPTKELREARLKADAKIEAERIKKKKGARDAKVGIKDKKDSTKYITISDVAFAVNRSPAFIGCIEQGWIRSDKDEYAGEDIEMRPSIIEVHRLVDVLSDIRMFKLDRISDTCTDRFTAVLNLLFDVRAVHQARDIMMADEVLNDVPESKRLEEDSSLKVIVAKALPPQKRKQEWSLTGNGLYMYAGNLNLMRIRGEPEENIKTQRTRGEKKRKIPSQFITTYDMGLVSNRSAGQVGNLEKGKSTNEIRTVITTIHAIDLAFSNRKNFSLDDIPDDEEDRFGALVKQRFNTERFEQQRKMLQRIQAIDENEPFIIGERKTIVDNETPYKDILGIINPPAGRVYMIKKGRKSQEVFSRNLARITDRYAGSVNNQILAEKMHTTPETMIKLKKTVSFIRAYNMLLNIARILNKSFEDALDELLPHPLQRINVSRECSRAVSGSK